MRGIETNKIVSIACGSTHAILLDDKGCVPMSGIYISQGDRSTSRLVSHLDITATVV